MSSWDHYQREHTQYTVEAWQARAERAEERARILSSYTLGRLTPGGKVHAFFEALSYRIPNCNSGIADYAVRSVNPDKIKHKDLCKCQPCKAVFLLMGYKL